MGKGDSHTYCYVLPWGEIRSEDSLFPLPPSPFVLSCSDCGHVFILFNYGTNYRTVYACFIGGDFPIVIKIIIIVTIITYVIIIIAMALCFGILMATGKKARLHRQIKFSPG